MDLHDALTQITEIRQQMARSRLLRGYRSATTAFSGLVAMAAAAAQAAWVPDPLRHVRHYLLIWQAAALLSIVVIAAEMVSRVRRSGSALQRDLSLLAAEQFVPPVLGGALLTYVLLKFAPGSAWLLPGLWAVLFSFGVFASRRLLTPAAFWVGAWYLLAGLACVALAQGERALSPWAMGITFGVGQLFAAAVLYWTMERNHGNE